MKQKYLLTILCATVTAMSTSCEDKKEETTKQPNYNTAPQQRENYPVYNQPNPSNGYNSSNQQRGGSSSSNGYPPAGVNPELDPDQMRARELYPNYYSDKERIRQDEQIRQQVRQRGY